MQQVVTVRVARSRSDLKLAARGLAITVPVSHDGRLHESPRYYCEGLGIIHLLGTASRAACERQAPGSSWPKTVGAYCIALLASTVDAGTVRHVEGHLPQDAILLDRQTKVCWSVRVLDKDIATSGTRSLLVVCKKDCRRWEA